MNILILGGTGAMGKHMVDILSSLQIYNIAVTTRQNLSKRKNVEYFQGNAHDSSFLFPLLTLRHWDAIVDFMAYHTSEFKQRVERMLDATDQYVYLSSARAYAVSRVPLLENSPLLIDTCTDEAYLATDEYALTKGRQEKILRLTKRRNWTIIRPYITFSETRLQLSALEKEQWLYRALKGRTIVFSKDIANKLTTITYGYDVAAAITKLIGNNNAYGETFHITTGENFHWKEILEVYLQTLEQLTGKRPNVKMLDKWQPWLGGGEMQIKWDRLYNRTFDNGKILKYTGPVDFSPVKDALMKCLALFVRNPQFGYIDWAQEAKKDRFTGEWAKLSEIDDNVQKLRYLLIRLGIIHRK